MARKPSKPKAGSAQPRNTIVVAHRPEQSTDDACARTLTRPEEHRVNRIDELLPWAVADLLKAPLPQAA